jgi:hypothetical protein
MIGHCYQGLLFIILFLLVNCAVQKACKESLKPLLISLALRLWTSSEVY